MLTDPATYRTDPDEAWTRIKTRSTAPRFLAALRELARLRETLAQSRNVPRARILKDDALLELAANRPKDAEDLGKSRLLLREARRGEIADGILAAIAAAEAMPGRRGAAGAGAAARASRARRRWPTCCGCCSRRGPRPRAWRSG